MVRPKRTATKTSKRVVRGEQLSKDKLLTAIRNETQVISEARDRLRKLVEDAEEVIEISDRAVERLEEAADIISEVM